MFCSQDSLSEKDSTCSQGNASVNSSHAPSRAANRSEAAVIAPGDRAQPEAALSVPSHDGLTAPQRESHTRLTAAHAPLRAAHSHPSGAVPKRGSHHDQTGEGQQDESLDSLDNSEASTTLSMAKVILQGPEESEETSLGISTIPPSPPVITTEESTENTELPTEGVINMNNGQNMPIGAGRYAPMTFNNVTFLALIDSGCTFTLLPKSLFVKTGLPYQPLGNIRLKLASGEDFVNGKWVGPVEFKIGSQTFRQLIIVAEKGMEAIIGMDFLEGHNTAMLFRENILLLNGEPIMLISETDIETPKVVAVRRVTLAPSTGQFIEAKLQTEEPYPHKLICESLRKGRTVVETVQYEPGQTLYIPVANNTSWPLKIRKNMTLANTSRIHPLFEYWDDALRESAKDGVQGPERRAARHQEQTAPPPPSSPPAPPQPPPPPPSPPPGHTGSGDIWQPTPTQHMRDQLIAGEHGQLRQGHICQMTSSVNTESEQPQLEEPTFLMEIMDHYKHSKPNGGWLVDDLEDLKKQNYAPVIPEHMKKMYEAGCKMLDKDYQVLWGRFLEKYSSVFSTGEHDVGCITGVEHRIPTGDAEPVRVPPRKVNKQFAHVEEEITKKMLDAGIIAPSTSPWRAAPVLLRKKDGTYRYAIDYRELNKRTIKSSFPIPNVQECVDFLQGNTIFSKLDAAQGYFQIPMAAEDAHKTCFQNRFGSWEYRRLPFGLCGAPQTFSMAVHSILESLLFKIVMAYLDDIVVPSKNIFEHFVALQLVFDRLVSRGVKLKPSKCEFFQKEIEILGRIATGETMAMSEKDIEVVKKAARPTSKKQVEQWLGLASYHRQFMKDFGEFAWPLYQLVHSKKKFKWTIEHERAFQKLKDGLSSPPVLGLPREDCYFILDCDSSAHAIGAALVQDQGQGEVVIAYSSASLSKTQMGYCATKRKLLSLCYHVRHWRHYLLGKPFVVRTDHSSLRWLSKFKNTEGQLHRWIEELSAYDIEIVHRKGALHVNADSLSRLIEANHLKEDVPFDELPCGGCEKCRKEAKKWEVFNREVDDVEPLTAPTRPASPFKAQAETNEALLAATRAVEPEEAYELLSAELPFHAPQDLRGPRLRAVKHPGQLPTIPEAPEEAAARMAKARAGQCDISPELQAIFEEDQEDFEGFSEQDLLIPQITKQWGMSTTEVAEAQKNDPHLGPIHRWFYYSVIPTEARLKNTSKATRHYWLHKGQIKMINQVLYFEKASESKSMLLLPLEYKEKVFKKMHDDPLAGHMGREKTIQAVKDKFYWYGMTTDVKLYVANCHTCQRMKDGQRNAQHEMGMNPSGYVLERVHLDHQGPLPMTMKGNKHILLMVDAFSKFLWAAAVPDQKAETTAKQLIDWFTEYGMPGTLVTDQGKGFESELVKELCEKLDVTKVRCTPYRAKANGQIERYNKVVSTILRSYC